MSAYLAPVFNLGAQFFTNQGVILAGGKVYVYQAGTLTPVNTWTAPDQVTLNSNPLVLDGAGRLTTPIWVAGGAAYKFVLTDSAGASVGMTLDNIRGINDSTVIAPAALSVTLGSNATGSLAYSPLKFNQVLLDNTSSYAPATGLFTAPTTGVYLIQATVNYTTSASAQVWMSLNGAQWVTRYAGAADANVINTTWITQLTAGATAYTTIEASTLGTLTVVAKPNGGNTRGTTMNIALLSAT